MRSKSGWSGVGRGLVLALLLGLPTGVVRGSELQPEVADAVALYDLWVEEQMGHRGLPGLAVGVVRDGELVWGRGYGVKELASGEPVTPDSVFRVGSITKLFTATAILHLRDAGKLRLDDPVVKHLPWFRIGGPPANEPTVDSPVITVEHLLTHTAGLPREAAFPYWTDHEFPTLAQIRDVLPTQQATYSPGVRYKYSNLGMALLGAIVEAASGTSYEAYLQEHLFGPLGMSSSSAAPGEELLARRVTGYSRRSNDGARPVAEYYETGALAAAANIVSTLEDLARFASLQFQDGPAGGAQVLRGATVREMHRPHFVYPSWSGGRGLGFAVSHRNGKTIVSHGGWVAGNRCHLIVVPSEKIAVIAMTNADDGSPSFFGYRAYDLIGSAVHAAAPRDAKPEAEADPGWERYLGTYTDPWGWETQVLLRGGHLVLYDHSYPPDDDPSGGLTTLVPVPGQPHTFRIPDGELMVFEMAPDGSVTRIKKRYDYLFPLGAEFTVPVSAADGR